MPAGNFRNDLTRANAVIRYNSPVETTLKKESILISPYGGELRDLCVGADEREELKRYAETLPSMQLSARALCDLELLATGAFSPLDRFMSRADHERVVSEMRLADGTVFPVPVALPIDPATGIHKHNEIALRDQKNNVLALITIDEAYEWDRRAYAQNVLGTENMRHPLVAEMGAWGSVNISGALKMIALPKYYDFQELRLTPAETRSRLDAIGNGTVVAFQTRNPLHRAHEEMTKRAIAETGGVLLMHPVVGLTKPGDIDHYSRVRTYKILTEKYYEREKVLLALLPLAMRMAGPREALWHAIIRRNYGANHLIVGRDHASPGVDENRRPFYGAYDAQELVERFSEEIGVKAIKYGEFAYLPETGTYEESAKAGEGSEVLTLSGTQVREEHLNKGRALPEWFTRAEVAAILQESFPPKTKQGVCIWFTGLSGAGKSTTAEILITMLMSFGRRVTMLDGDIVRTHLSAGLGFDREGRDANVRRIGFVASEIARHGGMAVCAAVSPYLETRAEVRKMTGEGNFVEVFVDTPLAVCEERDTKGMYARARRGELKDFTGIDDPYEPPQNPEITIHTTARTPEENAQTIIEHLITNGFIEENSQK